MSPNQSHNVIETSHIAPPNGTVPSTSLPLTFFDVPWLTLPDCECLFFFSYPNSTERFLKEFLPNLKQSLSLTLQHFFPYAGNLIIPPPPDPPYLRYTDGKDSLVFTVTESVGTNFESLKTDSPKDIRLLHDMLPKIPPPCISPEGFQIRETMVIQITIFPGVGICIGNTATHVTGDGLTFSNFMKYWMSLAKSNGGDRPFPPIHGCRNAIKDLDEVAYGFLEQFWSQSSKDQDEDSNYLTPENMVSATFTMSRNQIDNLKRWVKEKSANQSQVSTFVVTLAFAWLSLIKTLNDKEEEDMFSLVFNIDCRNRLRYADPVPSNYFGNCMAPGFVDVKKQDLVGEKGFLAASKAITASIKEVLSSDVVKTAHTWGQGVQRWTETRYPISTSGSPRMGLYDLDFGLGKPCKVEIVHIKTGGALALCESRDGHNGVEIGLVLEKNQMETFSLILQQGINNFHL